MTALKLFIMFRIFRSLDDADKLYAFQMLNKRLNESLNKRGRA